LQLTNLKSEDNPVLKVLDRIIEKGKLPGAISGMLLIRKKELARDSNYSPQLYVIELTTVGELSAWEYICLKRAIAGVSSPNILLRNRGLLD
jgi:hypothetical protein